MNQGASDTLRCPTCRARLRQGRICLRCGADLAPLIDLALRSHCLRARARQALYRNDPTTARRLVMAAQLLHRTTSGEALQDVVEYL